jgi:DNA-binding NtrC family response regulator
MAETTSILIVDDELGVRESLKMIFKPVYRVHTAADGKEALQCLQKNQIDVVTLDLKMPGLSGMDILQEIKKRDPNIEVIIITAYGTAQNTLDAAQYGAMGLIAKPFNMIDIINNVNKSLERRNCNLRRKNFTLYNSLVVRH